MNDYIRKYKFTCITFFICLNLFLTTHIFDYDFFEKIISVLQSIERYEGDEFILYFILVLLGIIVDLIRIKALTKKVIEIQGQRLRAMQATMVTVQDIVGNALNGLLGLRLKTEDDNGITEEDLEIFDTIIYETADKINKLRDMDSVSFKEISKGLVGLDIKE